MDIAMKLSILNPPKVNNVQQDTISSEELLSDMTTQLRKMKLELKQIADEELNDKALPAKRTHHIEVYSEKISRHVKIYLPSDEENLVNIYMRIDETDDLADNKE